MLIIKPKYWFDLNKLGLYFSIFILILMPFYPMNWLVLLPVEVLLIFIIYILYNIIDSSKNYSILINTENQWFIQLDNNKPLAVEFKDYWFLPNYICIWLKGTNKSLSFMISRSIIGAELFSQIRTRIL